MMEGKNTEAAATNISIYCVVLSTHGLLATISWVKHYSPGKLGQSLVQRICAKNKHLRCKLVGGKQKCGWRVKLYSSEGYMKFRDRVKDRKFATSTFKNSLTMPTLPFPISNQG